MLEIADALLLIVLLGAASFFDLKERRIPNKLLLAGLILKTILIVVSALAAGGTSVAIATELGKQLGRSLTGVAAISLPIIAVAAIMSRRNPSGGAPIGGGDLKLLALLGLWCEPYSALLLLLVACVLGLIFFLFWRLRCQGEQAFPFAPAIAGAALLVLLLL